MNTMEDLRKELVSLMRETIHGREIDFFKQDRPAIPHMLGITPIGERHKTANEEGTILDPNHEFWETWHDDNVTGWVAEQKVNTAMNSLIEDGTVQWTYKNGDPDSDIVYVEVSRISDRETTDCIECGASVSVEEQFVPVSSSYRHRITLDCDECDFTGVYDTRMHRL